MNTNDEVTRLRLASEAFQQRLGALATESGRIEHRNLIGAAIRYLYPALKACSPEVGRLMGDGFEESLKRYAGGLGGALSEYFHAVRVDPDEASENLAIHVHRELAGGRVGGYYALEALRAIFRALTDRDLAKCRDALGEAFDLTAKALQCPDPSAK